MQIYPNTPVSDVLCYASRLEDEDGARSNLFTRDEGVGVLLHAAGARELAMQTRKTVSLTRKRARPNKYGWSGWRYVQWTLTAYSDGSVYLVMDRVKGPANDKSFDGVECGVAGVAPRSILWQSGRQTHRVVRWDDVTRKAIRTIALLLIAVSFSVVW